MIKMSHHENKKGYIDGFLESQNSKHNIIERLMKNNKAKAGAGRDHEVKSLRPAWPIWGNPISTKNTKISQAWWCTPVVPPIWEAETEESLEPERQRLQQELILSPRLERSDSILPSALDFGPQNSRFLPSIISYEMEKGLKFDSGCIIFMTAGKRDKALSPSCLAIIMTVLFLLIHSSEFRGGHFSFQSVSFSYNRQT
ncbi:hypothetical protein AAY473_017036 [Plecturocebus cupreus]